VRSGVAHRAVADRCAGVLAPTQGRHGIGDQVERVRFADGILQDAQPAAGPAHRLFGPGRQPFGEVTPDQLGITVGRRAGLGEQEPTAILPDQTNRPYRLAEFQDWERLGLAVGQPDPVPHGRQLRRQRRDVGRSEIAGRGQCQSVRTDVMQEPQDRADRPEPFLR